MSCWSGRPQSPPKHHDLLSFFLIAPLRNLIVRPYCWKCQPHTLDAECRKIKLELSWKLPPCWSSFLVLEDVMQTFRGEKPLRLTQLWTLWDIAALLTCQVRCVHWCNSGTTVMWHPTALWLDLRPAVLEGTPAWYCKPDQEPWQWRSWA